MKLPKNQMILLKIEQISLLNQMNPQQVQKEDNELLKYNHTVKDQDYEKYWNLLQVRHIDLAWV